MDGVTAVAVAPHNEVVLIGTTQGGWNGNRISASGLIGVTGYTAGPLKGKPAGGTDGFGFVFNDTGKQVGARQFGSKLNDLADSIAVTASGQWVIGGSTSGELKGKSAGADDAFVIFVSP